jgi:hypothetical protein
MWDILVHIVLYTDGSIDCTVGEVLAVFTGFCSEPAVGFDKQLKIHFTFTPNALPTASTCGYILNIPTVHKDRNKFVESFYLALKGSVGFGHPWTQCEYYNFDLVLI